MTRSRVPARTIGIVVPAHDEEHVIAACLASIERAAAFARRRGHRVVVVVACDACTDDTRRIVRQRGHVAVVIDARNVGTARAAGAAEAIARGAEWLAFTDADTLVSQGWLVAQLALDSEVVCGTVGVHGWEVHDAATRVRYDDRYEDRDGHRHVHGANLGIDTGAYGRVGGFSHRETQEDVHIVEALARSGARIAWSALPRVLTSARRHYRAPAGFGAYLTTLASIADAA